MTTSYLDLVPAPQAVTSARRNSTFRALGKCAGVALAVCIALATMALGTGGVQGQTTTFSVPGPTTWIAPSGVTTVQVEAWGGGGGGGGCGAIYDGAGGGAGGSYVRYSVSVTPGTTYNLTVGAGGTAGAEGASGTATTGGTGGSSYFGNTSAGNAAGASVLAVGGPGGVADNTAGTGSSNYHTSAGGTGTTSGNLPASGAAANTAGSNGGVGPGTTKGAGNGGSGAGSSGNSGGGAGGAGASSAGNGTGGTGPGGGGGGGDEGSSFSASNGAGGAGGNGQITLTWTASTPIINTTGTPAAMSTIQGTPSVPTSFSASGANLTANITVTAPTGFEVSLSSGTGYSSSVTLTQSSGAVASTPIFVRLLAADSAGSYSGNVSLSSTGATTVTVAVPASTVVTPFTQGNLAIEQLPTNGTSSTLNIIELNPSTASQSAPVNTYIIPSTGASALRQTNSGSTGRLATSNDGTLLAFTGFEDPTGTSDETSTTLRGAASLNQTYQYVLQASYTDSAGTGDQTRGATYNNGTWYMSDKNGIWLNGATAAANTTNVRPVKSFGGQVYALTQNASTPPVIETVSADGTTLTGLPGLGGDNSAVDFYMLSSGVNGSAFDILYVLDGATVTKYSLVSGTWVANGTATALGVTGDGFCAAGNGSGAYLYTTTGATSTVVRITDTAGYNQAASINTANNVTLYTAASGFLKGVVFAPTATALPDLTISASAPANATAGGDFNYTLTVANSGAASASGITAQFTLPAGLSFVSAAENGSAGFTAPVSAPGGVVTFTGGSLAANTSDTLTVTVTTSTANTYTAAAGAVVVDPSNTIAEANENNNGSNIAATTSVTSGGIAVTGSPSALSTTYGTASTPTSFSVSGNSLTANIILTPTAGFEISTTSGSGYVGSTSFLTLTESGGTVAATTIYVRLAASAAAGTYTNGGVSATSTGAATQNVAIPSSTVNQLALTINSPAVTTKPWDGTTAATITGTLVGVVPGDTVTLLGTGTFASPNDGTGIAVTSTSTLAGANASDYTLTQPTGLTGTITASANLSALTSNAGGFLSAFNFGTTGYVQYVGSSVTSVTLTPAADTGATVTVNGASASTPVSLVSGNNTITVHVTNGGLTQNYTVNVIVAGSFTQGDLVVTVYGNLGTGPVHSDGQTTIISLAEFSPAIAANSVPLMAFPLPSAASGNNVGITGEYATSSESRIQLSSDGQCVTIGGYSPAQAFPYAPNSLPNGALAQSPCATVPRVMALISASGSADTSSVFNDIYNTNNPRCVFTPDDTNLYLSGQGAGTGDEGGIYYTPVGTNTTTGGAAPTAIFTGVSTRQLRTFGGNLYYTCDQNSSKGIQTGVFEFSGQPTTSATPLTNTGTRLTPANNGSGVNYSPDGIFFANSTTMYIADTGDPKAGGTGAGGIQKWVYNGSAWVLQYNMTNPNFVSPSLATTAAHGETGFESLAGTVVSGVAYLYATTYTAGDGDANGLYAITDTVSATSYSGQTFTEIAAAPGIQASGTSPDFIYKGVSLAPALTNLAPTFATSSAVPVAADGYVANDVTLGTVTLGFTPTPGQVLTLVDNTGSSAIVGNYVGLPSGSVVSATYGGTTYNFQISYTGGDGNDITLTLPAQVPTGVDLKGSTGFRNAVASPQTR